MVLRNFRVATTGTYYIGFRSFSDADQGYIQIDDINVGTTLAYEAFDLVGLSYFPNPVKDLLYFKYAEKIERVEVYNLLGQQVFFYNGSANEIDLSSLSNGAYIVKILTEVGVKSVKIIKQ